MSCTVDNLSFYEIISFRDIHIVWGILSAFTLLTLILTTLLYLRHLTHFTFPSQQKYFLAIIPLPAIVGIIYWIVYVFYNDAPYVKLVSDVYEPLTLMAYYFLMKEYLRLGYQGSPPSIPRATKAKVLQFCVVVPVLAFISVGLYATGKSCATVTNRNFSSTVMSFIRAVSTMVALITIIRLVRVHEDVLKGFNVWRPLIVIKVIVALEFLQSIVLYLISQDVSSSGAAWTNGNFVYAFQSILLCFEMMLVSFYSMYAFPLQPNQELQPRVSSASEKEPIMEVGGKV